LKSPKIILLFVISISVFSCITHKKLKYFNTEKYSFEEKENIFINEYRLVPGDIINIKVSSPDENSVKIFNKADVDKSSTTTEASLYMNGYLISDDGKIDLPIINKIHIKDLTISEAKDSILFKISQYYKQVTVDVRLVNFRVSVLGEANSPGTYIFYNDRVTISEVIARAGGFNDFAKRNEVRIIRTINNKRQIINFNFQDPNQINQKEYFLLPNDVIYINPLKAKVFKSNISTVSLVISMVSLVLIVFNTFNR